MEGRILTIVVGWYSGYQEGRYVFLALECGGCVFGDENLRFIFKV